MNLTRGELERARDATRTEIEAEVMRRLGTDGVAVLATVAPCTAPRVASAPTLTAAMDSTVPSGSPSQTASSAPCAESDGAPITLCATIPATAKLTDVDLYLRGTDSAASWTAVTAGQEVEQARFAEKPVEGPDSSSAKQVCEGFVQWSQRARVARMVVHYSL